MDVVSWSFVWPSVLVLVGNVALIIMIAVVDIAGWDGWLDLTYALLPFPRSQEGLPWLRVGMMAAFAIGGAWVLLRFLHCLGQTVYESADDRRARLGMTTLIALADRVVEHGMTMRGVVPIKRRGRR